MPNKDLRQYLATLQANCPNDILSFDHPVEADYLPSALVLELDKRPENKLVSFKQLDSYPYPVVTNVFGTRERIALAANTDVDGFYKKWLEAEENPLTPVISETGAVQEKVYLGDDANAEELPIIRHFPGDAGRYISSGILVAKDPDTGVPNLSFHRMELKGPRRFGVSLHSRAHLWDYFRRAEEKGQDLEVAVVIGAHPAIYLSAASKMGIDVDEYAVAGALMGEALELVKCKTIDVEVPAGAEIVLEGRIRAHQREKEGPFGEYTGYSTFRSTENVFEISAITTRTQPIYLDIVPGYSSEHLLLGRAAKEAHVYQRMKEMVPTLHQINWPKSGTHFHCYFSLENTTAGVAKHALMLLFGLDQYVKLAVAVDKDIDVFDEQQVLWAMATRMQADKDVFIVPGVFCNRLDPSASPEGTSAKMGIDATMPHDWDVSKVELTTDLTNKAKELLAKSQS